ncbi:MAG: DUF6898 family protein [Rhodospirillales bacterium]|jgi:hypothetical protein|nr:hypothetical protein [Magnetospirillum sp.]
MPRETLFEFHQIGAFTKATAIDAETGLEVSIVGPSNSSELVLRNNALRKLAAALKRHGIDVAANR